MHNIVVVLYEPQDDINIGTVVRACGNFGVRDIRLVRPRVADPSRVLISAPNAEEAVRSLRHFETLEDALADCVRVFGATARARRAARLVLDPLQTAAIVEKTEGAVALLFGREDHGLPNEALDRCDGEITIPTSPDYHSLNLAQAVLLILWEVFRRTQLDAPTDGAVVTVRTDFEAASREQLERMFETAHEALDRVGFFKYGDGEHVMRSVRSVFGRAQLDERELAIWFGVFKEILESNRRRGDVTE